MYKNAFDAAENLRKAGENLSERHISILVNNKRNSKKPNAIGL